MKKLLYLIAFCFCKLGIHCYVYCHGGYTKYCLVCERTYVTIGDTDSVIYDHFELSFEGLTLKEMRKKLKEE